MSQFWCSCCDIETVDSEVPETGSFFSNHGHTIKVEHRGLPKPRWQVDGNWELVVWAFCAKCLKDPLKLFNSMKLDTSRVDVVDKP